MRIALGVSYAGDCYHGWQSQPSGNTIQDKLESALAEFAAQSLPVKTVCAGRTDSGVHALNQVVHFDTELERDEFSWIRGTNRFLPEDIAVQWCRVVPPEFHVRQSATGRRYVYIVSVSPVRPSLEAKRVGWCWQKLDLDKMLEAASFLLGVHDFSAFRSSQCQALTPVRDVHSIQIEPHDSYWCFEFKANAFLQHMIRNLMGSLIAVGMGRYPPEWVLDVLESKRRELAAPTYGAEGLYFLGPQYGAQWGLPQESEAMMLMLPCYKKHPL
ncbi:MAG: tRNA pseudouridine(38-40) synthase TruA [Saezia sp.]